KIYLNVKRKVQLPPVFRLRCPICGYEDVYSQGSAVEEDIYTFTCPICKLRFFVARKPPLIVGCPHCSSALRITSIHGEPEVIRANPKTHSPTITSAMLLGALLGAISSRYRLGGAIIGGFIGALIGVFIDTLSEPEAKYIE
ncbi:MAG: hypothetical protein QXE01_07405, partial [Sulfolobales archaeon]